jgi:hypothetical protein
MVSLLVFLIQNIPTPSPVPVETIRDIKTQKTNQAEYSLYNLFLFPKPVADLVSTKKCEPSVLSLRVTYQFFNNLEKNSTLSKNDFYPKSIV